jgi:hypothetical protein
VRSSYAHGLSLRAHTYGLYGLPGPNNQQQARAYAPAHQLAAGAWVTREVTQRRTTGGSVLARPRLPQVEAQPARNERLREDVLRVCCVHGG